MTPYHQWGRRLYKFILPYFHASFYLLSNSCWPHMDHFQFNLLCGETGSSLKEIWYRFICFYNLHKSYLNSGLSSFWMIPNAFVVSFLRTGCMYFCARLWDLVSLCEWLALTGTCQSIYELISLTVTESMGHGRLVFPQLSFPECCDKAGLWTIFLEDCDMDSLWNLDCWHGKWLPEPGDLTNNQISLLCEPCQFPPENISYKIHL